MLGSTSTKSSRNLLFCIAAQIQYSIAFPQNSSNTLGNPIPPAIAKDSTVSNTTFNVISIILAFGSLIVGILGVIHLRRRRSECTGTSQALSTTQGAGAEATVQPAYVTNTTSESSPPRTSIATSTSVSTLRDFQASTITTVLAPKPNSEDDTVVLESSAGANEDTTSPTRPSLASLRLRSSRWGKPSTEWKMTPGVRTFTL